MTYLIEIIGVSITAIWILIWLTKPLIRAVMRIMSRVKRWITTGQVTKRPLRVTMGDSAYDVMCIYIIPVALVALHLLAAIPVMRGLYLIYVYFHSQPTLDSAIESRAFLGMTAIGVATGASFAGYTNLVEFIHARKGRTNANVIMARLILIWGFFAILVGKFLVESWMITENFDPDQLTTWQYYSWCLIIFCAASLFYEIYAAWNEMYRKMDAFTDAFWNKLSRMMGKVDDDLDEGPEPQASAEILRSPKRPTPHDNLID